MNQHSSQLKTVWNKKPFLEQMANIGSEVHRAINWKERGNLEYAQAAFVRSLELFDISKDSPLTRGQFKELCRTRELWVDFFAYENLYSSNSLFFKKYFDLLTIAFRNKRLV
ncbi:hypothetical protein H6764_00525 [Candidatus Nomurabacteria bacterium]|nr:hypothetical protein [Candidatus Nomurabacteria bacterium]